MTYEHETMLTLREEAGRIGNIALRLEDELTELLRRLSDAVHDERQRDLPLWGNRKP